MNRKEVITCPICKVNLTKACAILGKMQAMDIHQIAHEREILRSLLEILKDSSNPEMSKSDIDLLTNDIDLLAQWREQQRK